MTNNILRFWERLDSDDPLEPLFEAAPILMQVIDDQGAIIKVSRFWADKLGYSTDEMIGRPSLDFLTPDSRQYASETVLPEFYRTGQIDNVHYDFIRKDGKTISTVLSAIAEYDASGTFINSLSIMFDNSDFKRAEQQLHQKQRSEAIGALVGGVAHDFNNLLAVIQGNLEFLEQDPDDVDRLEFIENALEATKRAASVTQQLLTYGRRATLMPKIIDLNEIVLATDKLIQRVFPSNIILQTTTQDGLWRTSADAALLQTALLNILNNARDALAEGGRIIVETRNIRIDDYYVTLRKEEIAPGPYVMLAISDTGHGMDGKTLERVFEPYFTTKSIREGAGLGLSMVYGFMRQSQGAIRVYSEEGRGTTFRLYFKAAADTCVTTPVFQKTTSIPIEGRMVLLVEDDDDVRRVLARQLESEGADVVSCASGVEAYEHVCAGLAPDALVTDIVMPGSLQGPELATKARGRLPGLKVLYISGYPSEAAIHGSDIETGDRHLIKPVRQADFRQAVNDMLASDPR